jgi:hypothetical protein
MKEFNTQIRTLSDLPGKTYLNPMGTPSQLALVGTPLFCLSSSFFSP